MNENFNCNSKCLIYLLNCKTYGKQYAGKAVDRFKSKWNNYKTDARESANGNTKSCKEQTSTKSYFAERPYWVFSGC